MPPATPLKIAHRGASAHYPENTLLAFRKAVEMGADAVECDVRASRDGHAIVIHDRGLGRTTGVHGFVRHRRLADIKALDAGMGQTIPTLHEVLDELAPHITVFIEIKGTGAIAPAARAITHFARKKNVPYERMPVISFHAVHLDAIRKINPRIVTGLTPPEKKSALTKAFMAKAVQSGMWSVNPCIRVLDKKFVELAHAAGLKVFTWTANSQADIDRAYALGVDGIMSDWPERL